MKQMASIISGAFTSGEGKKGNFTARDANGEQIFIHKKTMESLGWLENKDITFPFYAITGEKEINTRDANGELTDTVVKRVQALSIFKTEDDMLNAYTSGERLAIKAKSLVQATAKASGLTQSAIDALLAVA